MQKFYFFVIWDVIQFIFLFGLLLKNSILCSLLIAFDSVFKITSIFIFDVKGLKEFFINLYYNLVNFNFLGLKENVFSLIRQEILLTLNFFLIFTIGLFALFVLVFYFIKICMRKNKKIVIENKPRQAKKQQM